MTANLGALTGVRVVDLTTILMGPMAARMLADHGADVIRVEAPSTPKDIVGGTTGLSAIVLDTHRNKRSVILDLKTDEGAAAMAELIDSADVLVTNMRSGALDRLGLSAERLRATHPALIHCVANGYGADGPYADRAAYDDAIQAISGLAALPTRISGEPAYVPSVIVDKTCALFVVQAVMAALLHRHNTKEGQTIRVPMFETMVSFLLVEHLRGAALVPPQGELGYKRLLNPNRRPYRAADGWIALLPYSDGNWRDFFALIDQPELADDPRFLTHAARIENATELYQFLVDAAPTRTIDEWISICEQHSIPASPVLDIDDLFDDVHLTAVDLMPIVEHPHLGQYRTIRHPVSYDTMSTELRHHAPIPGEHTTEIFRELGWSEDRIQAL
ncbi:MAG: CaiB/BaiF CoA transferase family protein [Acidimicrobiales bacterium]|jgi:crotonobetainyl-CoA:carnitine CoA-transferase CaiB-like acyl-CoA transferase